MKWFKHLVRSKSDPHILESEVKFKAQGPYVFWRMLEILSDENAVDKPLIMNFKVFKMWFPSVTRHKLVTILIFFRDKNRIIFKLVDENIELYCNKLSTISSDYSEKVRRVSEQSSKLDRKMSALEVDLEVEVEKDIINNSDFEKFWTDYHSITKSPKTDKEPAFKKWKKLNNAEKEKACEKIKDYYDSLKDKGYCKKARTYLYDKNFNDELKPVETKTKEWGEW